MPHPPTPGGEIGGSLLLKFIPRVWAFVKDCMNFKKLVIKADQGEIPTRIEGTGRGFIT